jgi:hypothetical protein
MPSVRRRHRSTVLTKLVHEAFLERDHFPPCLLPLLPLIVPYFLPENLSRASDRTRSVNLVKILCIFDDGASFRTATRDFSRVEGSRATMPAVVMASFTHLAIMGLQNAHTEIKKMLYHMTPRVINFSPSPWAENLFHSTVF